MKNKIPFTSYSFFVVMICMNISYGINKSSIRENTITVEDSLIMKKDTLKKYRLEEVSIQSVRADRKLPVTETILNQQVLIIIIPDRKCPLFLQEHLQ